MSDKIIIFKFKFGSIFSRFDDRRVLVITLVGNAAG